MKMIKVLAVLALLAALPARAAECVWAAPATSVTLTYNTQVNVQAACPDLHPYLVSWSPHVYGVIGLTKSDLDKMVISGSQLANGSSEWAGGSWWTLDHFQEAETTYATGNYTVKNLFHGYVTVPFKNILFPPPGTISGTIILNCCSFP
jgi:hypothetical protein